MDKKTVVALVINYLVFFAMPSADAYEGGLYFASLAANSAVAASIGFLASSYIFANIHKKKMQAIRF